MVQVTNGILQGISKFYVPLISLFCGAVIKTLLNVVLISNSKINIYGAEFATVSCYVVALIINLIVLKKKNLICLELKTSVIFILSFLIL